jgi:hypothetical protein
LVLSQEPGWGDEELVPNRGSWESPLSKSGGHIRELMDGEGIFRGRRTGLDIQIIRRKEFELSLGICEF